MQRCDGAASLLSKWYRAGAYGRIRRRCSYRHAIGIVGVGIGDYLGSGGASGGWTERLVHSSCIVYLWLMIGRVITDERRYVRPSWDAIEEAARDWSSVIVGLIHGRGEINPSPARDSTVSRVGEVEQRMLLGTYPMPSRCSRRMVRSA